MAEAIRRGDLSSQDLVRACLQRIGEVNPKLNAVVQVTADQAMADAQSADEEWKEGHLRGPLHGIPMTIKDSIDTAGVISTWGTMGRQDYIPKEDATVVSRLKEAGAILLGKSNSPELTLSYATDNKVYGRTNNPYDLDRTPGGSSGGAAAIVAAGGSPFDIGSDTGGSIRLPAHFCGITGLRPTSGRIPRTGHAIPPGGVFDNLSQLGPLARFVEDLALILPIISGPDGKDTWIQPVPFGDPDHVTLEGMRVAFFTDNGICSPTKEVMEAVEIVAQTFTDLGLEVEECRPDCVEDSFDIYNDIYVEWMYPWALKRLEQEGTAIQDLALQIEEIVPLETLRALKLFDRWEQYRVSMMESFGPYDLILSPVMAYPAYPHDTITDEHEGFSYTNTFSLTGWPAVVVPATGTKEGLPIDVQIVAQPWREEVALKAAAYVEQVLGGWVAPAI
jgi:amidase